MYIKIRLIDTEFIHDLFDIYFLEKDFSFISYLSSILINHITNLSDGECLSEIRQTIIRDCQEKLKHFKIFKIICYQGMNFIDRLNLDGTGYYVFEILYYGYYQEEINVEYPLKKFEINMSNQDYYLAYYYSDSFHSQLSCFLMGC